MPSKLFRISWENEKVTTKEMLKLIENLLYYYNVITFKVQEVKEDEVTICDHKKKIEKSNFENHLGMLHILWDKQNEMIDRLNKE